MIDDRYMTRPTYEDQTQACMVLYARAVCELAEAEQVFAHKFTDADKFSAISIAEDIHPYWVFRVMPAKRTLAFMRQFARRNGITLPDAS